MDESTLLDMRTLLGIILLIGFVSAVSTIRITPAVIGVEPPSRQEFALPTTAEFNETGILVFYPNNISPVPYLFYQTTPGITVAKALTFSSGKPANFSTWSGARVSVSGIAVQEHVVVSHIAYVAAP